MKIVIISDSHGNLGAVKRVIDRETPFDYLFHLGDGLLDLAKIRQTIEFCYDGVGGNNDPSGMLPKTAVINIGKRRCFCTHGHLFGVHQNLNALIKEAKKAKADLVFFGHTHKFLDLQERGIRLLNPGSICQHLSREPSYFIVNQNDRLISIDRKYLE